MKLSQTCLAMAIRERCTLAVCALALVLLACMNASAAHSSGVHAHSGDAWQGPANKAAADTAADATRGGEAARAVSSLLHKSQDKASTLLRKLTQAFDPW